MISSPRTPSGCSRLCSGPAENPSRETPNAETRTFAMVSLLMREEREHARVDLGPALDHDAVVGARHDPQLGARDRVRELLGVLAADQVVLARHDERLRADRAQV